MNCTHCQREIAENSNFCYYCGAKQPAAAQPSRPAGPPKRLTRSTRDRVFGGVLGGFAEYTEVDLTVVRLIFVLVTIFTGIIPGVIAYIVAWVVIPQASAPAANLSAPTGRRLMRSVSDRRLGGVCGGLGEFLGVDSTVIRLVWALLSIVPGAIVGGIVAYIIAWMVIPEAPRPLPAPAEQTAPQHS